MMENIEVIYTEKGHIRQSFSWGTTRDIQHPSFASVLDDFGFDLDGAYITCIVMHRCNLKLKSGIAIIKLLTTHKTHLQECLNIFNH